MTDAARKSPAPPTAEQLTAELADCERQHAAAQRASSTARTELPALIAGGDPEQIAECRRKIRLSDARVQELAEAIEAGRGAIEIAKTRDRAAANERVDKETEAEVVACERAILEFGDAIDVVCQKFSAASARLQALADKTTRAGVPPDSYEHPHLMFRLLPELFEHGLALGTKGQLGKFRTLNGTEQLAKGVTASSMVQQAAESFLTLTLRRVRTALHL